MGREEGEHGAGEDATSFLLGSFSVSASASGCLLCASRFSAATCLVCFSSSPAFFWVSIPVCLSWPLIAYAHDSGERGHYWLLAPAFSLFSPSPSPPSQKQMEA